MTSMNLIKCIENNVVLHRFSADKGNGGYVRDGQKC